MTSFTYQISQRLWYLIAIRTMLHQHLFSFKRQMFKNTSGKKHTGWKCLKASGVCCHQQWKSQEKKPHFWDHILVRQMEVIIDFTTSEKSLPHSFTVQFYFQETIPVLFNPSNMNKDEWEWSFLTYIEKHCSVFANLINHFNGHITNVICHQNQERNELLSCSMSLGEKFS